MNSRSAAILETFVLALLLAIVGSTGAAAQPVDPEFVGVVNGAYVRALAIDSDGRILIAGSFTHVSGVATPKGFARLLPTGVVDTSFSVPTDLVPNPSAIAVQPDGRILVISGEVRRLLSSGAVDPTFTPTASIASKVLVQPDGRILIGGNDFGRLRRLNENGTVDATFQPPPTNVLWVDDFVLLPDLRVVVGGYLVLSTAPPVQVAAARLTTAGTLDPTFASTLSTTMTTLNQNTAIGRFPDGRLLVSQNIPGVFQGITQLAENGATIAGTTVPLAAHIIQIDIGGDGLPLVAGRTAQNVPRPYLRRLTASGTLDPLFNTFVGSGMGEVLRFERQPDGKIVVGGVLGDYHITRLLPLANQPPTISAIASQVLTDAGAGAVTPALPFTVGDPDGDSITVTASSSNQAVVSNAGISLAGAGANRTVTVASAPGTLGGSALITLSASDGRTTTTTTFTVTVNVTLPTTTPTNLAATVAGNQVTFTWGAPTQGTVLGYVIEAGFSSGRSDVSLPVPNATSFAVTAPDGRFFVRVRAETTTGRSGPSNEVVINVGGPPLAPVGLNGSVAGSLIALTWSADANGPTPLAYRLVAGSAPGLSDIAVAELPGAPTAFSANAPPGTYFVRLHALNAAGASGPSNEVQLTVGSTCTPPAAPTGLTATVSAGSVTLNWTPSAGATGYVLLVGTVPGVTNVGSFMLPNISAMTSAAPPGTFFVRVVAVGVCTNSAPSGEVQFTIG